jgi:hypothetical protein
MHPPKHATVDLEPEIHRALRRRSIEDADDLTSFRARAKEPTVPFEQVLKDLRKRGKTWL